MPSLLTKPLHRETRNRYRGKPVMLTVAPAAGRPETLLGVRLKGERTQYIVALSDVYRWAALAYGSAMARAKREARKAGIPWAKAKRDFNRKHRIP